MHGFKQADVNNTILSDSGIELIRMASQGNPRKAHQVILPAMRLSAENNLNHLPDDVIQEAINLLKNT